MNFTYTQGGPLPAAQTISVYAVDCETKTLPMDPFDVTLGDDAPWLTLNRTTGPTPFEVQVSVNPAGLTAGIYHGNILLAVPENYVCNPSEAMSVTLTVLAAPPPPPPPITNPTITFITANNASFNSNDVTVRVAPRGDVVRCELFRSGQATAVAKAEESKLPLTTYLRWQATLIPKGAYTLTATAYNAAGGQASASITVNRK